MFTQRGKDIKNKKNSDKFFYETLISEKKQKNDALSKVLYEKNKLVIELSRKIDYLIQEHKFEVNEILDNLNNEKIDPSFFNELKQKYEEHNNDNIDN